MSIRVYVPNDSTALSLGSDQVAQALAAQALERGLSIEIIRNGSRGLFWLEPMLEVETDEGRVAYGPVAEEDITSLLDADFQSGSDKHDLYLGLTEEIPFLKQQQRLTFARAGIIDPLSLEDYQNHHGYIGLKNALAMTEQQILDQVKESGLRGRGGAAFPAGIKWQTVHDCADPQKYIVCNADEGDSGTFADRLVMEADPFMLIEGMTIAGLAVGANKGYVYIRSEYFRACDVMNQAIEQAKAAGLLGQNILGSDHHFELEVRMGAGAYICGEETSLLESVEGKRGLVRAKPPLPALEGLFGKPTVVNNVLTLAAVPFVLAEGAKAYADFGMGHSRGTMPFQIAGNIKHGGLVEMAFGTTLRDLVEGFGQGTASGRPARAIQVGGPLGAYLPESQWDIPIDYEAYKEVGAVVGHGGVVVFDDTVDMLAQARFSMEFCVEESCGKCTPCRIGSVRGVEVIDRIAQASSEQIHVQQVELLNDLCETMIDGSLCAMGGMTPIPVQSALQHFPEDFHKTDFGRGNQ